MEILSTAISQHVIVYWFPPSSLKNYDGNHTFYKPIKGKKKKKPHIIVYTLQPQNLKKTHTRTKLKYLIHQKHYEPNSTIPRLICLLVLCL